MGDYSLVVSVSNEFVGRFNQQGQVICFAFGVAGGENDGAQYNVVAASDMVSSQKTISWSENYAIAGSNSRFMRGIQLGVNTNQTGISPGQSYTLPGNWTNGRVNDDPSAPRSGFRFNNEADGAAAVLFKSIDGRPSPIYINRHGPMPRGVSETLVPKRTVAVWFGKQWEGAAGTLIEGFGGPSIVVDLSNNQSRKARVAYDGDWKIVENS